MSRFWERERTVGVRFKLKAWAVDSIASWEKGLTMMRFGPFLSVML